MDPWYLTNLVCPRDGELLDDVNAELKCSRGHIYPIISGVPVMLLDNTEQTLEVAKTSLRLAKATNPQKCTPTFYVETLGINEEERKGILQLSLRGKSIDPVVSYLIGASNGYMYRHLIGKLESYPIPEIRLPYATREWLLDVGCNWGRWSIAATKKGYSVVGIDPSLGAVMAARRVSTSLGLDIKYVVADGRFLPFPSNRFDRVFSYSVLQHFAKQDAVLALNEISRVLTPQGKSLIQMANSFGLRSLYHQARRGFTKGQNFEVRYWSVPELKRTFKCSIGDTEIKADCFGGLGIQRTDWQMVGARLKLVIAASEILRTISKSLPFLRYAADSLYLESQRPAIHPENGTRSNRPQVMDN
jgi:2-polyprenyl-3-methyl-5-hydroxy-6-metoxy-1,4-benzoquinol methylase/uncharacterized protein YbaR (Trm112 family)